MGIEYIKIMIPEPKYLKKVRKTCLKNLKFFVSTFSVAVFMFRFIKGELPYIFTNMYIFNSDVHNYVTRNVNELKFDNKESGGITYNYL